MVHYNRGEEEMNFQLIVYFNILLFLIGIFGICYCKDIISIFISFQFIITSGLMNFLVFSQFLYKSSLWDKVFIILGATLIYFLMFCLVYYIYLNKDMISRKAVYEEFKLFKISKNDWWREENN